MTVPVPVGPLCSCGRLRVPNRSRCARCLKYQSRWNRQRRNRLRAIGRCTTCGMRPHAPRRVQCSRCRRSKNRYQQALNRRKKQEGSCRHCGLPSAPLVFCELHRQAKNQTSLTRHRVLCRWCHKAIRPRHGGRMNRLHDGRCFERFHRASRARMILHHRELNRRQWARATPIQRQRHSALVWAIQREHRAMGLCLSCSRPAITKTSCAVHLPPLHCRSCRAEIPPLERTHGRRYCLACRPRSFWRQPARAGTEENFHEHTEGETQETPKLE
jgi:hypothetical protein